MAFSGLSVERAKAAEQLLVNAYHTAFDAGDLTKAAGIDGFHSAVCSLRIFGARGTIRVGGTPDGRDIIEPVDSSDLDMIVGNALAYLS